VTEQYITWDYVDGWIGVRCEPKDPTRASAMTRAIPPADRKFLSHKRLWIFRPRYLAQVLAVVEAHCPNYPVFLEAPHEKLLAVALQVASGRGSAGILAEVGIPPRPEGVHVGTLDDLLGRW
jgi:hypothetical protein